MNIFTDGARSRKRLSVAKKAVAKLRMMGVKQKVGIRDGFVYKVTSTGKGWIKAPFGIYVVLSDVDGVRQFTCDSVGSPALPYFDATAKDRYVLMPDPMPPIVINDLTLRPNPTDAYAAVAGTPGTQMLEFDPLVSVQNPPYNVPPWQWGAPTPVVMPVGAEAVSLRLSYQRSSLHFVNTTQVTHCYNSGETDAENDVKSLSITQTYAASATYGASSNTATFRVPLHASAGRWGEVWWKSEWCWSPDRLLTIIYADLSTGTYYAANQTMGSLLPASPLGKHRIGSVLASRDTSYDVDGVLPDTDADRIKDIRAVVFVDYGMVFLNYRTTHTGLAFNDLRSTFVPAAAADLWWMSPSYYTTQYIDTDYPFQPRVRDVFDFAGSYPAPIDEPIRKGDYWVVRTGGQFNVPNPPNPDTIIPVYALGLLVALKDAPGPQEHSGWSIVEDAATYMTSTVAEDFVMGDMLHCLSGGRYRGWSASFSGSESFPDAEGVMYTWHRITDPACVQTYWGQAYSGTRSGGLKFVTAGGFTRVPLYMPESVNISTDRNPELQLLTATTYMCLTKSWDNIIHNIHIGSPFSSWVPVDMPAAAVMYSVRVTIPGDMVDECGFIGVGKVTDEDYEYYIFFKPPGKPWVRLSPIPLVGKESVVDIAAAWDVCVFGDDAIVSSMLSCKQHPISRPEMPGAYR